MPELIHCGHCGRKLSSQAARRVGGVTVCPNCVAVVKAAAKARKIKTKTQRQLEKTRQRLQRAEEKDRKAREKETERIKRQRARETPPTPTAPSEPVPAQSSVKPTGMPLWRKLLNTVAGLLILSVLLVFIARCTLNHMQLQSQMNEVLESDARNSRIEVSVYYEGYIGFSAIVFDITSCRNKAPIDVMRCLLQFAAAKKDSRYSRVVLACRGEKKFLLEGSYFQRLGQEYGAQNPVYTLRTFPSHVYRMDGHQAYGTWTGGLLGVVGAQMKDLRNFVSEWLGGPPVEPNAVDKPSAIEIKGTGSAKCCRTLDDHI